MAVHLPSKHAFRRGSLRASLALSAVALTTAAGVASSGASAKPARGIPTAVAARSLKVSLNASLILVGRPGHVNTERGTISGTFRGTIAARFVTNGSNQGTGTFTVYPTGGGSFSGQSTAHGHVVGAFAYFTGVGSITGGTGKWAHASASGLQFHGVLNRQNYHSTSSLTGTIHL